MPSLYFFENWCDSCSEKKKGQKTRRNVTVSIYPVTIYFGWYKIVETNGHLSLSLSPFLSLSLSQPDMKLYNTSKPCHRITFLSKSKLPKKPCNKKLTNYLSSNQKKVISFVFPIKNYIIHAVFFASLGIHTLNPVKSKTKWF